MELISPRFNSLTARLTNGSDDELGLVHTRVILHYASERHRSILLSAMHRQRRVLLLQRVVRLVQRHMERLVVEKPANRWMRIAASSALKAERRAGGDERVVRRRRDDLRGD